MNRPGVLRREDYEKAAKAGLTIPEAAKALDRNTKTVRWHAKRHGITFTKGHPGRPRKEDREQ